MDILRIYTSLLYAPDRAYAKALNKKVWTLFFPLLAAIGITAALNVFYYNTIDMGWLLKQMVANVPEDQQQTVRESLTKTRLVSISLVGVFFMTLSVNLFRAFVYWFVLKIRGNSEKFTRLFAIVMWSTAPLLLILPAGATNIYINADLGMLPNDVNPVSLNRLYFQFPGDSAWGQMLSTFSLINVWEVFLVMVGLRVATALNTRQAAIIAILPEVIVYAIWSTLLVL
ncbi:hypothetical protein KUL17_14900 [Alteromonas sp. KUL17]|uniref:YIP1 family protein n=1 Tax=Alteromonas sp. KUL17 TaxID=2480796 RepID=UPI0010372C95|nr:YIP1 family protein [Alteromonas sp. KUL17]TAP29220.1 DUF1282 domain-containing protein [Alteromonas sp. KUL17]GEA02593.1 hypothetical protein KUL17_14900 [Alteromonas sp. KUL17]